MSKQVIRNGVYYGTIDDMVEQILADAAVIKAAEDLAECAGAVFRSEYENTQHIEGAKDYFDRNRAALAAFRAAQENANDE